MFQKNLKISFLLLTAAISCGIPGKSVNNGPAANSAVLTAANPDEGATPNAGTLKFKISKSGTYTYEGPENIKFAYEVNVEIPKDSIAEIRCTNSDFEMRYVSYGGKTSCVGCNSAHPAWDLGFAKYQPVNIQYLDKQNNITMNRGHVSGPLKIVDVIIQKFYSGTSAPAHFLDSHQVAISGLTHHRYEVQIIDHLLTNGSANTRDLRYIARHFQTDAYGNKLGANSFTNDALFCSARRSTIFVNEVETYFNSLK